MRPEFDDLEHDAFLYDHAPPVMIRESVIVRPEQLATDGADILLDRLGFNIRLPSDFIFRQDGRIEIRAYLKEHRGRY